MARAIQNEIDAQLPFKSLAQTGVTPKSTGYGWCDGGLTLSARTGTTFWVRFSGGDVRRSSTSVIGKQSEPQKTLPLDDSLQKRWVQRLDGAIRENLSAAHTTNALMTNSTAATEIEIPPVGVCRKPLSSFARAPHSQASNHFVGSLFRAKHTCASVGIVRRWVAGDIRLL